MAITRAIRPTVKTRGVSPRTVKVGFGKVAEMQRRGVVHFHAVLRLDGADPEPRTPTARRTRPRRPRRRRSARREHDDPRHPAAPGHASRLGHRAGHPPRGIRAINRDTDDAITDGMVAGYLAKYATKAAEATGHTSRRFTSDTIDVYADYSVTFRLLREARATWQCTHAACTRHRPSSSSTSSSSSGPVGITPATQCSPTPPQPAPGSRDRPHGTNSPLDRQGGLAPTPQWIKVRLPKAPAPANNHVSSHLEPHTGQYARLALELTSKPHR
jgi:hypothetical protein